MNSPCKECKRRKVGCHNVEKCADWRKYVEDSRVRLTARYEASAELEDIKRHLRRHGHRVSDKPKG